MPADLTNPFGESCCDGAEQCSAIGEYRGAQTCGCDPAANWFCAEHKFQIKALALIKEWREEADPKYGGTNDYDTGCDEAMIECANQLEAIL